MTTLDHQIRERLDRYAEFRNHDGHQLAGALRAVLTTCNAVEVGMDGPSPVGQAFADTFRRAIALALGITQEAEQCTTAIHNASSSAPERCALESGHEGECTP